MKVYQKLPPNARFARHGFGGTPTYSSWVNMRTRCENPKSTQWKWYGAKGVTVCERWKTFGLFWKTWESVRPRRIPLIVSRVPRVMSLAMCSGRFKPNSAATGLPPEVSSAKTASHTGRWLKPLRMLAEPLAGSGMPATGKQSGIAVLDGNTLHEQSNPNTPQQLRESRRKRGSTSLLLAPA